MSAAIHELSSPPNVSAAYGVVKVSPAASFFCHMFSKKEGPESARYGRIFVCPISAVQLALDSICHRIYFSPEESMPAGRYSLLDQLPVFE